MPRPKRSQQAVVPTTALTASAHRYSGTAPRIYQPNSEWQKRCYYHYSVCGEARYAARYFGRAMSRAVLYIPGADGAPATTGPALDHLSALFGGPHGQAEMLETVGVHLIVAGECYLVGRRVDGADIWEVVSVHEIMGGSAGWQIKAADSEAWIPLVESDVVIRVWNPKPDRRWEADSPFRSLLPVLDEIERLTRYIHAQTTSRLASNGLLLLSDDITFPPPPPIDGKEQEVANEADALMRWLGALMLDSLKGDGSPSEVVPGVVMASSESIDKIKHLTFWTPLDENALGMRRDAIHRFALGMDLPPEMILGMSSNEGTGGGTSNGVSHWGAWMIEEQAIKLHIEPMLDSLCASLTGYYLRPLLPVGSADQIRSDTSALRLRPDRSKESIELVDRGWLAQRVALVENGFDPEDVPTDDERKLWLLMKIATGNTAPEQVGEAAKALGVDLGAANQTAEAPTEQRPPPSLEDHPTRPRTPAESALIPVFEHIVYRALERGGNRLRNLTQTKTTGHSYEVHTKIQANGSTEMCLEDAFATAPLALEGFADCEKVLPVLHAYCAALMETGTAHTRDHMVSWCSERGIL